MPYDPSYADAIASVESGGKYSLLGPETKGDRAYGKYQIMGANVPQWTKEILGQSLTPEQFLASPEAQDAVFQGKFGQYVDKYGPEGAAKAWFAGERGMNNPNAKDVLGTTVASYAQKFNSALGQPQGLQAAPQLPAPIDVPPRPIADSQPVPGAFNPGNPMQAASGMPAYGWSPQESQQAPASSPQMAAFGEMPMMQKRQPPNLSQLLAAIQQPRPNRRGFY